MSQKKINRYAVAVFIENNTPIIVATSLKGWVTVPGIPGLGRVTRGTDQNQKIKRMFAAGDLLHPGMTEETLMAFIEAVRGNVPDNPWPDHETLFEAQKALYAMDQSAGLTLDGDRVLLEINRYFLSHGAPTPADSEWALQI
jgi:hypothetical protein